jgi:signal transduction histidine kinase
MSKVLLFTKNSEREMYIKERLKFFEVSSFSSEDTFLNYFKENYTDVVLIDTVNFEESLKFCRAVKYTSQIKNVSIIFIVAKEAKDKEQFLKYANSFLSDPIDDDLLYATINSSLNLKNSLDELAESNTELSTNLYRLNVLNQTVSELSVSFNKKELIDIMTDGIDKSLSFNLCYSLVFNNYSDITLIINSVHPISQRLEEAIKLRGIMSFKNFFKLSAPEEVIKIIKNIKRKELYEYDLNVFNFDASLQKINIKDKYFGIIEVFRKKEFKNDDIRCLQTLVQQATFPIQNAVLYEEMIEQNKKLEEMEKKKSEFFSIVSHELRTPLTSIQNAYKILLNEKFANMLPDKANYFIKMIERNCIRAIGIVQDWLDSVQAESGRFDYKFEIEKINPIVDGVIQNLSTQAEDKQIQISFDYDKNIPSLYIDKKRVEQVITNLVVNAVKYIPNRGKIFVKTELIDAVSMKNKNFMTSRDVILSEEYVLVTVADNGPGIAKEDISKVFEKFEQVNGTLSRNVGGTGLGLFIAKKIAEVHNGFLWLDSIVGKGSNFYFAIPILAEDERFTMQLKHDISNANKNNKSFSLITFCENKQKEEPYLIQFIKKMESEGIFKKTIETRCFYTETKERFYYSFYDINMNSQVRNFVIQKMLDYAKTDKILKAGKKIYYSQANYPEDAGDSEVLIKKSKKLLKEVI